MDYQEASKRLQNHGNLPNAGPEDASLGYALFCLRRGQPVIHHLPKLYDDVLDCLEFINRELNGPTPSEAKKIDERRTVDRWGAYSIASLQELHLSTIVQFPIDDNTRRIISQYALSLELAWGAVLSGGTDSIRSYLDDELNMRGILV
jgi:hypothetical protein